MAFDHALRQCLAHPVQIRTPHRILKPRQCRLRGQRRPTDRVTSDQQLLDRILGQSRGIVAVWIPAGDRLQALAHQIPDRVFDLARLPSVHDAARQALRQTQPLVAGLQQNCSTIGTAVALVELRHHRTAKQVRKQDSLSCDIFWHAKASRVVQGLVAKPFYHHTGFCLLEITNFPGLIQLPPETGEDLVLYFNAGLVHKRVLQPPVTCPPG
jgi:hypothetical protein